MKFMVTIGTLILVSILWIVYITSNPNKSQPGMIRFLSLDKIDSVNETERIRCWGVDPKKDRIHINRPYMSRLQFDPKWGFSTRSVYRNFRLLG